MIRAHLVRHTMGIATVAALLFSLFSSGASAGASEPSLAVLSPGTVGDLFLPLPVNVVFVGYEIGGGAQQVDPHRFFAGLSPIATGLIRLPLFAGFIRPSHVVWSPAYRTVLAPPAFDDAFFAFLAVSGHEIPPTPYQEQYNQQAARSLDITDCLAIDAKSVEDWLAENAPAWLAVDTTQPTVFFINWYGRPDFRFHVYVEPGEPDPDTGHDFGLDASRALIAWGGSPPDHPGGAVHRVWFHDLSAGPDAITSNWDLTTADLTGDGYPDDRLPPVWEYGNTAGYRPFTDLSGDLAKILRYVAIDTLFVHAPLYDPAISAPGLPSSLDVSVNQIQTEPGAPAASLTTPYMVAAWSALQPWNTFSVNGRPPLYDRRLADVHQCFRSALDDPSYESPSCYGNRLGGNGLWDMLIYYWDHRLQLIDTAPDYSFPVLLFDDPAIASGTIGLADEDFRDGTQAYIAAWASQSLFDYGDGASALVVHEVGHHLGMSHPHDGEDYDPFTHRILDFSASGGFYFAWTGDESATVMSYTHLARGFSQFDRDNMGQWMTVGYLNEANQILARIYASPQARSEDAAVVAADHSAVGAVLAYIQADYQTSAGLAKQSYEALLGVAARLHVPIEPEARQADVKAQSPGQFFADPVDPYRAARPSRLALAVHTDAALAPDGAVGWVPTAW